MTNVRVGLEIGPRYARIAGASFNPGDIVVVAAVPGNAITDFGAPDRTGPWDDEPLDPAEASRLTGLLVAGWRYLDSVLAGAPEALVKAPRGGGRDRDAKAV